MRALLWPPILLLLGLVASFLVHRRLRAHGRAPFVITALRWLLGLIFVLSGLSKLLPGFPNLIGPPWLEERLAPYGLALFAQFVACSEAAVGVLLFSRRFATLGAMMLAPMLAGILAVTVSLHWRGTPYVVAVLLLFDGVLLVYDYPKLKGLLEDRPQGPAVPTQIPPNLSSDGTWLACLVGIIGLALLPAVRQSGWSGAALSLAILGLVIADWRRSRRGET